MPESSPIVIAYDGSEAARAAVNGAAELFGSRPAIVLTVWEPGLADYMLMPNTMGTGTMMMPYDPSTVQAIDKAAEDHARDIADAIIETASERGAAAIVIGSRGLKGLKSKMMGSSSSSVLGRSELPVVIVHAPGAHEH